MMIYKNFRPTQFDTHYPIDDQENWFVAPVSHNRDSDVLTRANWESFLEALNTKENEDTFLIHRFGHWGPGWFEIILINPANTALVKMAEDIESALADYPVIDDEHFSALESEEANEVWANCYSWQERIEYIRKHNRQFEFNDFADMLHCVKGEYFAGYASELIS